MRHWRILGLMLLTASLGACMHVRGVVVEEDTGKPLPSAVFTVGRPDGIGIYQRNAADSRGRFDFYISPTDDSALYVYDSSGSAASTMRRIDHTDINDHMRVLLPRANPAPENEFGPMP